MPCKLCTFALAGLAALAGGSLVALTQPDASTITHKSNAQPGKPTGNDPEHPGTNMPQSPSADAKAMQDMMKQMQELAAPGPNHKFFENWVGKWDTTTTVGMTPGMPAHETHGHSEFSWLIGGTWLQERHDGTMMGLPLKGFGLSGYDNFNKRFVNCWVDSLSTGMITTTGSLDPTGKVLTLFGQVDEPTTGEHGKTVRFQTTVVDDDTHRLTIDEVQHGQPFTVVETVYRRAK
jgi:hypothetical protein